MSVLAPHNDACDTLDAYRRNMPLEQPDDDVSVHQAQQGGRPHIVVSVHECLGLHCNARDTIDAHRCTCGVAWEGASHGYHPCHGRRYNSGEDRRPSPNLLGPQAFGRHILNAAFLPRYIPSTNILKNSREINPRLWLEDYWLAYQAGGADNDDFIIRNFPLFRANSARTWLEHLPSNRIQSWANLKEIFVGNF